jgi:hypothetical protein
MRGKIFALVVACAALTAPLALAGEGAAQYVKLNESEWGITGVPKNWMAGMRKTFAVT